MKSDHATACRLAWTRSAADVASLVPTQARVLVHGAAATPTLLLDALSARADLDDVSHYHLHTCTGSSPSTAP